MHTYKFLARRASFHDNAETQTADALAMQSNTTGGNYPCNSIHAFMQFCLEPR